LANEVQSMDIVSHNLDNGVRIEISGEVDMHNSPDVRAKLLEAARRKVRLVVVNLGKVKYIDSSGLATLVECLQYMADYGGKLALVGASKSTRDVFAIARLDKVFSFYDSEDEALASAPKN
jgi:anti-sigma B factor antagonist